MRDDRKETAFNLHKIREGSRKRGGGKGAEMIITKNKRKKTMRIKIEDSDDYTVTDDNGVTFYPTAAQVKSISKAAYSLDNTVLMP